MGWQCLRASVDAVSQNNIFYIVLYYTIKSYYEFEACHTSFTHAYLLGIAYWGQSRVVVALVPSLRAQLHSSQYTEGCS